MVQMNKRDIEKTIERILDSDYLVTTFCVGLFIFLPASTILEWSRLNLCWEPITLLALTTVTVCLYIKTTTKSPGYVPREFYPENITKEQIQEAKERVEKKTETGFERVRFCAVCRSVKPQRAHHCRKCRRCVLRMDHHCPCVETQNALFAAITLNDFAEVQTSSAVFAFALLITSFSRFCILLLLYGSPWLISSDRFHNCIGLHNHKYFLSFLLFAEISLSIVFVIHIRGLFSLLPSRATKGGNLIIPQRGKYDLPIMISGLILSAYMIFIVSSLLISQTILIFHNETALENRLMDRIRKRERKMIREMKRKKQKQIKTDYEQTAKEENSLDTNIELLEKANEQNTTSNFEQTEQEKSEKNQHSRFVFPYDFGWKQNCSDFVGIPPGLGKNTFLDAFLYLIFLFVPWIKPKNSIARNFGFHFKTIDDTEEDHFPNKELNSILITTENNVKKEE